VLRTLLVLAWLAVPGMAPAQSIVIETTPLTDLPQGGPPQISAQQGERGTGVVLRALDKVSGATTDLELTAGISGEMFGLEVGLTECRYPAGNPAGDAFAYLVIREIGQEQGVAFTGWMVASSPALSALDHARYDVWVLRCINS
jgi:hypothetical protein